MKINREDVLHIALLARLGVTDEDVDRLTEQLSNILENFEVLQRVNTDGVPPTAQSMAIHDVTADDKVITSMSPEEVLANAPRKEDNFFRVRPVLE